MSALFCVSPVERKCYVFVSLVAVAKTAAEAVVAIMNLALHKTVFYRHEPLPKLLSYEL